MYNISGEICGTIINSNYYHYIKNIFGDILGLVDENGGYVTYHTYDAWGNILSTTASIDNSLRYKGYYYDSETDMYYCHTRYYVPKWLRSLNSDNVEYLDTDDFDNIDWSQVGKATLSGAVSGAISGGIFGGIKFAFSAAKVANSLSGLSKAEANFDEASSIFKNTPMSFLKGGGMSADHIVARESYRVASFTLSHAQSVYNVINPSMKLLYSAAQFGLKQGIGYIINRWL